MTDARFMFRFRDLVASTILEHQKIIAVQGCCWWGWWKRPSEDGRPDVWDALKKATSDGKPNKIAFFNSGDGSVYVGTATQIISPSPGAFKTLSVPVGEEHLVPNYYRESPFSRAWLKLTNIEPLENFFGHYSFAQSPRVSGYTQATLFRLRDKKIISAEELRLMDTTVWEIRPSYAGDPSDQILLSTSAVSSAVTQEVVRCKSDNILHITDLHYAVGRVRKQHAWRLESEGENTGRTMIEAITSSISDKKIGLVIASGDFTFIGSQEEYDEAATALSHLLGILDLSADHLIIVPGNHDIQWGTTETYNPNSELMQAPPEARANYERFYERMMRHKADRDLAMGRRYVLPCGILIEICALNSSSLLQGQNFLAGMGRIDEGSFDAISKQLGWGQSTSLAFRLLVVHHHLALTEDLEPAAGYNHGFGIAVDAVRIQRLAAQKGVHLALHGHKHRAFLWRSIVFELPQHANPHYRLGELSIVGGGSAGSTEVENDENYFNVISFSPTNMKVTIYRARDRGAFSVMQLWSAPLQMNSEEGRLEMGDWRKI